MAVYTDFHWDDPARGVAEMVRVSAQRVVVLTVDRRAANRFWLTRDYFPEANDLFRDLFGLTGDFPGHCDIRPVPIPCDCSDGFVHAFWRRPREYLDDGVRSTMALFARLPDAVVADGIQRLAVDLDSGAWRRRNQGLCSRRELDLGHRLVVWRHPR
jgi:hypothetical protein